MKNKGFTLVELLAVIVLLGILSVYSVPKIVGLLDSNTRKVYVNDAIKLAALAEYKIRASSTEVEKPDNGDCIVMSLVYLDNSDFDSPPGEGEYVKEASFVVVRNNNGNLEYSTMLVEHMKDGGYKGVKLSTVDTLNSRRANSRVTTFKSSEIVYVEDNHTHHVSNKVVDPTYINKNLGNGYTSSIERVYNYPNSNGAEVDEELLAPSIIKASLSSASGKDFNSTDVRLEVSATDKDTERSELQVRYNIVYDGSNSSTTYPSAGSTCLNRGDNDSGCYLYGGNTNFTHQFDFSKRISYDGKVRGFTMYIVVSDPDGNYDSRKLTYSLHINEKPTINEFSISRADGTKKNFADVRVKLSVSDDIDNYRDLQVCMTDNKTSNSCTSKDAKFVKYSSMFDNNGYMNYTFMCGNSKCGPFGDTKNLYVYVRDSNGEEVNSQASYKLDKAPALSISSVSLNSLHEAFMDMDKYYSSNSLNKNSLRFRLNLNINKDNDFSSDSDITVELEEATDNTFKNFKKGNATTKVKYSDYKNGRNEFSFINNNKANYDGKDRYLRVTITDQYGQEAHKDITYSNVYKNQAPVVYNAKVEKLKSACVDNSLCEDYGSLQAVVSFDVIDDLDSVSSIKTCVPSNSGTSCTPGDINKHRYIVNSNREYSNFNGSSYEDKTLSIIASDSYNSYGKAVNNSNNNSLNYRLYRNRAPYTLQGFYSIDSSNNNYHSFKFTYKFRAFNDKVITYSGNNYDSENYPDGKMYYKVCYKVDGKAEKCDGAYKELDYDTSFSSNASREITDSLDISSATGIDSKYNGQKVEVYVKLKDDAGAEANSGNITYDLYKDKAPVINSFSVESKNDYNKDKKTETVTAKYSVTDYGDTYQVCINDKLSDKGCKYSNNKYDGNSDKENSSDISIDSNYFTDSYGVDDNVYLYLHVKDSNGNVVTTPKPKAESDDVSAAIYTTCPVGEDGRLTNDVVYDFQGQSEVTAKECSGKCYAIPPTYKTDEASGNYVDKNGNVIQIKYNDDGSMSQESLDQLVLLAPGENLNVPKRSKAFIATARTLDAIATKKVCNESSDDYVPQCNFYTCFKKGSGYSTNVIGKTFNKYDRETTSNLGGKTYKCNGYFKGYNVSVDATKSVKLTPNGIEYCAVDGKLIDYYKYDSSSSNPYLIAEDPIE